MGIVSQQQCVSGNHPGNICAKALFGNAPLPDVLGGDTCQLFNLRRDNCARFQGDQLIIFLHDHRFSGFLLYHYRRKFDDLVLRKIQTCGFCVKYHQPVIPGKQFFKLHHNLPLPVLLPGGICSFSPGKGHRSLPAALHIRWPPFPGLPLTPLRSHTAQSSCRRR